MAIPPPPTGDDQALREQAMKRVKDRRAFQRYLVVYLVVNVFLWGLWALTDGLVPGLRTRVDDAFPWPVWVTLGWGIPVAANWWRVTRRPITSVDVDQEMKRLRER
ncbi:MAG: 2TM domain-containing protein [Kineosporiaceae bacterium]|jgi:hypothetical protein